MDKSQATNTLYFLQGVEKEEYGTLLKEVYISDRTTKKSTTYEQDADVRQTVDNFITGLSQLHTDIKADPESVPGEIPNPGEILDTPTISVVANANIAEAREAGRVDIYGLRKVAEALGKLGYPKGVETPVDETPESDETTEETPESEDE